VSPGQSIAHYRIAAKLGEGGMGAVYRATDTKLNRDVAIKVLPGGFAGDAARMQRFEREAQVLAALNHPNIAAIYGVEQGAIVMELVEGEDLHGPVPVETAIGYARQMAAGLEAAHEKGIIHRDLKPANIKVTPDGTVKLLDFGLAKASEETAASAAGTSPTMSPTVSLAMTQAGVILGTAAYMSPEQARGKPVDKRADIWAFGVVLYELLTGRALFGGGETAGDALAAVIMREPDLSTLPAATPPRVRRLLERCLPKDPKQRMRDIGEVRLALDELEAAAGAPAAARSATPARRLRLPWAVAGLMALAAAGVWLRPKAEPPAIGPVRFTVPLPPGTTLSGSPAAPQAVPSPDGRTLAFVAIDTSSGREYLWVRPFGSASARRLERADGANYPFWSPDSQSIGYFTEDKLKRVAVADGAVQTVCDVAKDNNVNRSAGDGAAWSRDGTIIFANNGQPLRKISRAGGTVTDVTSLGKDELWHSWPQLLGGERYLLYLAVARDPQQNAVYVQDLSSKQRVMVLKNITRAVWSPPGYLLFVREGSLLAQRMNPRTFQMEGEPMAVAQDVASNEGNGRSAFGVSESGLLAFRNGNIAGIRQLAWYDRQGKRLGPAGKPGEYQNPVISPDEKSVAVQIGATGRRDTWVMDLATGVLSRMTRDTRDEVFTAPIWSPDSRRLAISQTGGTVKEVEVSAGRVTTLTAGGIYAEDWSPDGAALLCDGRNGNHVSLLSLADNNKLATILEVPYRQSGFRFSPDGKYVAYASSEGGQADIYVAAFPSFAAKRKISTGGGVYAVWGSHGREILYRSPDGGLMSVEIRTGAGIAAGTPKVLFRYGINAGYMSNRFAATRDSERFLIMEPAGKDVPEQPEITVLLNWASAIR
jgi:Tol biopolymer transport system component/predicted Ser/Thr protein kinase